MLTSRILHNLNIGSIACQWKVLSQSSKINEDKGCRLAEKRVGNYGKHASCLYGSCKSCLRCQMMGRRISRPKSSHYVQPTRDQNIKLTWELNGTRHNRCLSDIMLNPISHIQKVVSLSNIIVATPKNKNYRAGDHEDFERGPLSSNSEPPWKASRLIFQKFACIPFFFQKIATIPLYFSKKL